MSAAWEVPVIWPGETAVVICSGPSLSLPQIAHVLRAKVEGKCRVMAINNAVFAAWYADWLHACDAKWWHWYSQTAAQFPGIKTTCSETIPPAWGAHRVDVLPPDPATGRRGGFSEKPDTLAGGGNGGHQGIELAAKAGSKRILTLGLDMKFSPDGGSHFDGDHPDGMRSDYENTMIPNFPALAAAMKERGVEVINCSPGTALTAFPTASIEDVL
jgi:hypothetical protein